MATNQRELFPTEWRLGRRTVYAVPHPTLTCYRLRVRWSQRLGLELNYDIYSMRDAERTIERIKARGFIQRNRWHAYFNPQWSTNCKELRHG